MEECDLCLTKKKSETIRNMNNQRNINILQI